MDNINKFEDFLDRMQGLLDKAKKQGHIIVRVEDLENTFPELKESEDDRIRKALIRFHKSTIDIDGIKGDEIVAWLEKQGEQKPFDYENANIQQKDFAPQEDAPRYSIGDVLCDKSCTILDKDAQPNYEIVDIRNGLYICDKGYIPISQQDEYELVAKKIEQKPAWSEGDEKMLNDAIGAIGIADYYTYDDKQEIENWLKSLKDRYTWKPNKEQMKALDIAIRCGIQLGTWEETSLKDLFNDLKKLKEE